MVVYNSPIKEDIQKKIDEYGESLLGSFKDQYPGKTIPKFIEEMFKNACKNTAVEWYKYGYWDGWFAKGEDLINRLGLEPFDDGDEGATAATERKNK